MSMIISSQRYLDDDTVESKRADHDYAVTLSPEFLVDGVTYQVVVDGHHSLEAAKLDGVEPEYSEATVQTADTVAMLARGNVDDYLVATRVDSDYYDVATGHDVW